MNVATRDIRYCTQLVNRTGERDSFIPTDARILAAASPQERGILRADRCVIRNISIAVPIEPGIA